MLINKIELENFRQYYGKHEISFSTDKEKNVTLVMGENGSGKTTIGQAFHWCLYGDTPDFLKKESLLSSKVEEEMYDGWNRPVVVKVFFEHSHKNYEITRTRTYTKNNGVVTGANPSLSIAVTENGDTRFLTGKELVSAIEDILPRELSSFFFLSGEKIDSMSLDIRSGRSKDFAKAVNTLLDLDYYKDAIKHLTAIIKQYDTLHIDSDMDEINKESSNIESCETNIKTFQQKLSNLNETIEYFDDQIGEVKALLASTKSSRELESKRNIAEIRLENCKTGIDKEITTGIKEFVKKAPSFFAATAMKTAMETLKEIASVKTEDIPERLHADLIDWIEEHEQCICGCKVEKGNEYYKFLEKWRSIVPPEAIGNIVKNMQSKILSEFRIGSDLIDKINICDEAIQDKTDKIDEYEEEIGNLSDLIKNCADTSELEYRLQHYKEEKKSSEEDRFQCMQLISNMQSSRNESIKKREVLLASNKEGQQVLKWKKTAQMLLSDFEKNLKEDELQKRNKLVSAVKDSFERIYGTTFTVEIDENYHIKTSTNLETSTGQGMSVIYAFLAGLLYVIKTDGKRKLVSENIDEETETEELESYPLVLDAPFSALDKKRISSICAVLPKVSEQIIIFIKDTDGLEAKKEMGEKIGACYKLVKVDGKDDSTAIEEDK